VNISSKESWGIVVKTKANRKATQFSRTLSIEHLPTSIVRARCLPFWQSTLTRSVFFEAQATKVGERTAANKIKTLKTSIL